MLNEVVTICEKNKGRRKVEEEKKTTKRRGVEK